MSMHEFLVANEDAILELCARKLEDQAPGHGAELADGLRGFVDEAIAALQRADGLPVESPLPAGSPSSERRALEQRARGVPIDVVVREFGSVSDAFGELAARHGMRFEAREYQIFNQCVDGAIAMAIERYWQASRREQEHHAAQRVGFLAHELRNALGSARLAFNVLRAGRVGMHSQTGAILERSLSRMHELVAHTLVAVQLQAGASNEVRPVRLAELLRDIATDAVTERGIRLEVDAPDELELDADARLLVSAIGNLVQNGIKYTRSGGRVGVRARLDGSVVAIEVEDECGGLVPAVQASLFSPFVRGGSSCGAGLGLAIARESVEAHAGSIVVENRPGRGCTFVVRLPQRAEAARQRAQT
jgi:hypothetical protein